MTERSQVGTFNRCQPLLERNNVPCEHIVLEEKGNSTRKVLSKNAEFYTLRILQGHRQIGKTPHTTERAIRLELSDENKKARPQKRLPLYRNKSSVRDAFNQNSTKDKMTPGPINFCSPPFASQHFTPNENFKMTISKTKDYSQRLDDSSSIESHDNGPIQLYELEVGESDFADLRKDQALLVDFSSFAKSMIDLLKLCDLGPSQDDDDTAIAGSSGLDGSENEKWSGQKGISPNVSNYVCRIEAFSNQALTGRWDTNKEDGTSFHRAIFSIVESNQFRELTHLSLNLKPGNDSSIRRYLSVRLSELLDEKSMLKFQICREKDRADNLEKANVKIVKQYNELAQSSHGELNEIVKEASEKLAKESSAREEEVQELVAQSENKMNKIREEAMEAQHRLNEEIFTLEEQNKLLTNDKEEVQLYSKAQSDRLVECQAYLKSLKEKMETIQNDLEFEETERAKLQGQCTEYKACLTSLERSNVEKEDAVSSSECQAQQLTNDMKELSRHFISCQEQLKKKQEEYSLLQEEHKKTNDLLGRYQRDRQEMKRRMKAKVEMIQKQEEILAAKEIEQTESDESRGTSERELERLRQKLKLTEKALEDSNVKLKDNKKTIDSNQQVSLIHQRSWIIYC